jgi:hypothetical protein
MMRFVCYVFGHKIAKKFTIAYDPAFGGIERNICRCGKVTIT